MGSFICKLWGRVCRVDLNRIPNEKQCPGGRSQQAFCGAVINNALNKATYHDLVVFVINVVTDSAL